MRKSWVFPILVLIIVLNPFSSTLYVEANTKTISVPDDYPTIQEAINSANQGDTVYVKSGVYYEHIVVNKSISLTGENCENTVVDATGKGVLWVTEIQSNKVNVTGFTFRNDGGLGLSINTNSCKLTDNKIINMTYGIRLMSNYTYLMSNYSNHCTDNIITGNQISLNKFGLILAFSSNNIISYNNITNNEEGIHIEGSPNNHIFENNVSNNNKTSIYLMGRNNIIEKNVIANNRNGIFLESSRPSEYFTCESSRIRWNNITQNLWGIGSRWSDNVFIYGNLFVNNSIQYRIWYSNIIWDNGYLIGGNYWSDYNGTDEDANGIGDTPYIIDQNNTDNFPLIKPVPRIYHLTLSLKSSTSLIGLEVGINGTLTNLYNDETVSNTPILVSYSVDLGETWNAITQIYIDYDGTYSAIWIPSATGNFKVKAHLPQVIDTYTEIQPQMVNLVILPFEEEVVFSVESNSTISNLAFNSTSSELSFLVSGSSETQGHINVYVAKSLVENIADIRVYLDGDQIEYTTTSLDDSWKLYFTDQYGIHNIIVDLGLPKPFIETPLGLTLILIGVIVVTTTAFLLYKKRVS